MTNPAVGGVGPEIPCKHREPSGHSLGIDTRERVDTTDSRQELFERLYETYYDEVHAFCVRRVGRDRAEDATSDTFVVAWRRIDDLDTNLERAWLFGIARNVVRNTWRAASRAARTVDRVRGIRESGPLPPDDLIVEKVGSDAVRCLLRLGSKDQEILMLSAWDDLSGEEIARVLGISANAVHQRLHRARQRLAKHLTRTQVLSGEIAEEGAL